MFNEIECRSIEAIVKQQNIVTKKDFENAYKNRDNTSVRVLEDISAEQETIYAVQKDGALWYLQSRYSAQKAAEQWAEQYKDVLKDNSVALVFGMGDGSHIRALMQENENCPIIIYEPCAEIFWTMFGREEIAELLETARVFLAVQGICESLFKLYLETFINYANYQIVQNCVLPNYDQIFQKEHRWQLEWYLYQAKRIIFNRNTEIYFSREHLRNMMRLSRDLIEQYSVVQLEGIVEEKKLEDMPAILVSAGPSLDKNIEKLQQMKDSAFLMVVDTALNSVLKQGIMPDMTITVDGHKPLVLFEDERVKRIPMAVSVNSNEKVVAQMEAMRFYELDSEEYLADLIRDVGKTAQGLPTGGSVANNAVSLLVLMGFKTIIFMGQDLAYPNGQQHTVDAYHKEDKISSEKKYIEVDDIYGNKVLTEENMKLYLNWFELYISVVPKVTFIDATEGGALIRGTKIYTMDEVIEQYGSAQYEKDRIWSELHPYLSRDEREIVKGTLRAIPKELDEMEKRMKDGLRVYDKMDAVNRKSHGESAKLNKMLNQVSELNMYMDESAILKLVKGYAIVTDYLIKGSVLNYDEKASMYDQMKDIIDSGRTLVEGYLDGIREFRKDLPEFLEQFD